MRFRTRVLLLWLVPVVTLMSVSFWMVQRMVQATVRDGLRESLRQNHEAVASVRAGLEAREGRFLRIAGENSGLKASLQLVLVEGNGPGVRATLEDQLTDLCEKMGFDLLVATTPDRAMLAGVVRRNGHLVALSAGTAPQHDGLFPLDSEIYNTTGVPVVLAGETVASLVVGDLFELPATAPPTVLLKNGRIIRSSVSGIQRDALEDALGHCPALRECDVRINGVAYISLPMSQRSGSAEPGEYTVLSLQNVDTAVRPVRAGLRLVFIAVFSIAGLLALVCGVFSSRSIVRPISELVTHLRTAGQDGRLGTLQDVGRSGIREIDDLTRTFNEAAAATSEARENLEAAYIQFVGSLAKALDARDRYTAGHSHRVSELAWQVGQKLGLPAAELERVRMGALLHDIGKIGISDTVLLKPGRLTAVETALIQQHPTIGRRILEKVQGFSEWLDAVELHHENWDGTGYPHGLRGELVPIEARIIHVTDAYDAMTSDRPYRKGMGHERAILTLKARAGLDFDPAIVDCMASLPSPETATKPESLRPSGQAETATVLTA